MIHTHTSYCNPCIVPHPAIVQDTDDSVGFAGISREGASENGPLLLAGFLPLVRFYSPGTEAALNL